MLIVDTHLYPTRTLTHSPHLAPTPRCTIKMLNHVQGCLVASMERGFVVWHEMVMAEQSREVLVRRAAAKMMMRSVAR